MVVSEVYCEPSTCLQKLCMLKNGKVCIFFFYNNRYRDIITVVALLEMNRTMYDFL